MTEHAKPKNKGGFRLRTLIVGLFGGLFLLAFTPVAVFLVWARMHSAEVDRLVAEIDKRGEPATIDQLVDRDHSEGSVDDVTHLWIEGAAPLNTRQFRQENLDIPIVGGDASITIPPIEQPWPEQPRCEAFLETNRVSIDRFHEAARRGGYCRFPLDYHQGLELDLSHVQAARAASRILHLELEVALRRNELERAARALETLYFVSCTCNREPLVIPQLVATAMDGVAKLALAKHLCTTTWSDSTLTKIREIIRRKNPAADMRVGLIGQRAILHSGMQDTSLIDGKWESQKALPSDAACHLRYMNRYVAAMELEFPAAIEEANQIEAEVHAEVVNYWGMLTKKITAFNVPATAALFETVARTIATDRAADTGIAIELYRREHGKLPETLEALTPKYLPSVPLDPFTGKPMIYKVEDRGFTIYGLGKNKVDDGGRIDNKPGEDNRIRDEGLFFPLK